MHVRTRSSQETAHRDESQGAFASLQEVVSEFLIRHRSVLDVISKFQEANARVNRAVVKAVTYCGCIGVEAGRQNIPRDISVRELKNYMETHLRGSICEHCQEVLEQELGRHMFYIAALCDLFALDLESVVENERKRVATLGVFNLT